VLKDMRDLLQAIQNILAVRRTIAIRLAAVCLYQPIQQREHQSIACEACVTAGVVRHLRNPHLL
jgi:hypothetical protein